MNDSGGKIRKNLRSKNRLNETFPVDICSFTMVRPITKPDTTKNMSTPTKPPLNIPMPKWLSTTNVTATARRN